MNILNWLGKILQKHISGDDTVLDMGCGIMQATTNSLQKNRKLFYKNRNQILKCKSLLGCELIDKYIEVYEIILRK